jgi:hypothetical protein
LGGSPYPLCLPTRRLEVHRWSAGAIYWDGQSEVARPLEDRLLPSVIYLPGSIVNDRDYRLTLVPPLSVPPFVCAAPSAGTPPIVDGAKLSWGHGYAGIQC